MVAPPHTQLNATCPVHGQLEVTALQAYLVVKGGAQFNYKGGPMHQDSGSVHIRSISGERREGRMKTYHFCEDRE